MRGEKMTTPTIKNKQDFDRKLAQIRSNPDLNDQAKRRMLQEAYDEAARKHRELIEKDQSGTSEKLARLEKGVFGLSYPTDAISGVDKERIRQSYRDASFRISGMKPEELERILERAERTGDRQLAKAVYHEATERGVRHVADSYLATHSSERKQWEEYTAARVEAESVESLLFGANAYGPTKPPELDGTAG
jgi:predicted DNA-binding protein